MKLIRNRNRFFGINRYGHQCEGLSLVLALAIFLPIWFRVMRKIEANAEAREVPIGLAAVYYLAFFAPFVGFFVQLIREFFFPYYRNECYRCRLIGGIVEGADIFVSVVMIETFFLVILALIAWMFF